jgi:hypothetical protein
MKLMTLLLTVTAAACFVLPASVGAQTEESASMQAEDGPSHPNGSLGFHTVTAPLGVRWWLGGQKIAVDLGFGFQSTPAPSYDEESLTGWAVEVGVPIVLKSWDKVHVLVRPGFLYESQEVQMTSPPAPFATDDATSFTIAGEIEAEVFIVDNFSVSASHGIGFYSFSPAGGGDSETSLGTLGNNFSHIGFHVYFLGGS